MAQTILIVDDDPVQRRLLEAAIVRSGMQVVTAPGGQPALDLIAGPRGDQISCVLLDLVMPDMDGIEVLRRLRVNNVELPVIVLTAKGGIDSAVEAMRAGANDFLVKPASPERISVSIRNQLKIGTLSGEVSRLKKKTENRLAFDDLIAKSSEMRQVFRLGQRAAQSNIPILIEGESGSCQDLRAGLAFAQGRYPRAFAILHRPLRNRGEQDRHGADTGSGRPARALQLARKRSPARKHDLPCRRVVRHRNARRMRFSPDRRGD